MHTEPLGPSSTTPFIYWFLSEGYTGQERPYTIMYAPLGERDALYYKFWGRQLDKHHCMAFRLSSRILQLYLICILRFCSTFICAELSKDTVCKHEQIVHAHSHLCDGWAILAFLCCFSNFQPSDNCHEEYLVHNMNMSKWECVWRFKWCENGATLTQFVLTEHTLIYYKNIVR